MKNSDPENEQAKTDPLALCRLWISDFEKCARKRDYNGAKKLFHPRVVTLGIEANICTGIEETIQNEFHSRWPAQVAFTFDLGMANIIPGQGFYVIAVPWECRGVIVGAPDRRGRATLVLGYFDDNTVKCLHLHMSENVNKIVA